MSIFYYPILLSRDNNNITEEGKYAVIIVIGSITCSLCICFLWGRQRQIEEPVVAPNNFTFV